MKKLISAILVFFFFTTNVVGATPSAVIPIPPRLLKTVEKGGLIDISPEIGIIENEIPGSEPLIIHIQDAHAVAEAQFQINRILRELTAKYHIQLIGLEGAAGKLAPGKFKFTSIDEVNSAVNNSMLREGRLTGAELFAVENQDTAVEFAGLEDKDLYKEDLRIFQTTLGKWEAEKHALDPLQNELAVLKKKIFSHPLQRFDEARSAFEERTQSLFSYVRYLNEAALKYLKLDLSDSRKQRTFSNLIRVILLSRLESKIEKNRGEIEKEKNALIETLASFAGEKTGEIENDFLVGTLREIGKGQWPTEIPPRYFFETLYAAAKKHGIELKADQAFAEFAEFLILRSEMDAKKLFREIAVLESRIYQYLIRTKEEKELVSISRDWNLLEKFLGLEVSREEYESASAREKEILPSALFARMKKFGERNKIQTSAHAAQAKRGDYKDAVSDELAGEARKFYDIARRRESAMVENLLGKVKEKNLKAAVLITGGFHSKGIDEILVHKGVAHITIAPRIREEVSSEQYHHVILGGKTWLEQALHKAALPETGVLSQNSVFEQSIAAEEKGRNQKIVAALISADDYLNPLDPRQPEKAALDAFVRDGIPALLDWTAKQPGLSGNPAQWVRAANSYMGDFGNTALGPARMALTEAQDSFTLAVVPSPASGMPSFNTRYALRVPFSVVGKPAAFSPETAMAASLGQKKAAASGLILPANVRKEFPDARQLTLNVNLAAAHQYRFNGKTYSPTGLLVPKSTAVEEIGDEELVALVLDPRPGFITVIVEDDNAMTYATMYLIMRLMELAQREFTFGLATGGTTESLRKGLGLANLAKTLFGQYLDWGKVRGMNTLDDYLWRDPEVLKSLGARGFWWPARHPWDRDRFDAEAYFLKYQLGAYRNEQKYMLLRNALPHWTEEQIDRAFVSPPVLYGSAIEAEERFIRNMSRFTTEAERSLFTLSGLGTGRHDGFAESALDAIALTGEIVTDLRKILDIPDTLTWVDYPRNLLQPDGLQRHSETTQIQNFGHFGGDMKFHKGFLRLMGKLRVNFIEDLINWLSMKRFEEIQDFLEKDYQFTSEEEFLTELQKVLNYYSAERDPSGIGTPPWSMTQKTGDVIERAFNPDTVKIVMVGDQPHKQESAADSYTGLSNPPFTPSALYLAPRTVLVATQMGARKMDKAGAWFFTSDNPNAVLLTGDGIEEDWRQTAEGQRIAGPGGVKEAWSKKLAEASSMGEQNVDSLIAELTADYQLSAEQIAEIEEEARKSADQAESHASAWAFLLEGNEANNAYQSALVSAADRVRVQHRLSIVSRLGDLGDSKAIPPLRAIVAGPAISRNPSNYDALLKEEAAIALAKLGDLEASLPVLLTQEHTSLRASLTIVSVLGNENPLAIPALYNIVADSSDETEVRKAVEALIKIGERGILAGFRAKILIPSLDAIIVDILGYDDPRAIPALEKIVQSAISKTEAFEKAARALIALNAPEVTSILMGMAVWRGELYRDHEDDKLAIARSLLLDRPNLLQIAREILKNTRYTRHNRDNIKYLGQAFRKLALSAKSPEKETLQRFAAQCETGKITIAQRWRMNRFFRRKASPSAASMGEIPAVRAWKGLVNIFPDRPAMGDAAAADITALMRKLFTEQDRLVLNLASAPSQMDVWHSLVKLMSADPDYWREKFKKDPATGRAKIKMIHFDEFTGRDRNGTPIDENHEVSFRWLLRQNFFNPLTEALGITFEDLEWYPIKGEAEDIQAEARRYEREVLTNPATGETEIIDISIGGYGENGHWAFNDPPDADFNDPKLVKVVDVTKSAQNVAQQIRAYSKYFQTKADISPAITETMAVALKRVRYHFLLVPGPAKANAIYQAHTVKNPTTEVPASVFAFSKHELEAAGISDVRMEGVKVYIDEKAAIGTFRELMEGLDISRQPDKNFVAELAKQVDLQSGRIANASGFHPVVHEKLAALKQAVRETAPAEALLSRLKDLSDTQLSLDVAHLDEFMGDPWAVYSISKDSGLVKWADDHLEINPIQGSSLGKGIQRILLVDDEAVVRLTLSFLIKSWNRDIEVVEKPDGIEGLAEYRRAKSEGRPFDLVVTDVNMPGMNGDQLAREINPPGENAVPVMMMTGLPLENEPKIAPLLESGQIRLALEKPFDTSDVFAFLDQVNRELLAKAEGSSLGEKADIARLLEAEGRNLSAVTGTIEQFSGGMVGNERNPAVLDYLLSIYADTAENQAITQRDVTEGEFAVLLTTPKYLSPESVKAQLKVNPRALVVVVAEGSADKVKQYTQAMRREFTVGFGRNFLVIPADRGQTGQVFKDLLFGKNRKLWDRASSLYPELVLNYSNLAQYTSLFASADDLRFVSASLATKLAAPRKAELNRGNVAYGEFNLYANTLAFLIARKGGFAKLSKEIPDVNQGIVPMNGINEFGFNISDLKETIAGLVSKFQEMLALGRAA